MATKTKLSTAETATLDRLDKRATALEGTVRSADQNLSSFDEFCAEADAMIALPTLSESERKTWQSRKTHCQTVQTSEERNKKAAAESQLSQVRESLGVEQVRLKAEKGTDGWYAVE